MKVLYITGLYPNEIIKEVESRSKGVIDYAANTLQKSFLEGLDTFCDVQLVNLPFVGSYPLLYKAPFLRRFPFSHKPSGQDINVGFINLPVIKLFFRYINLKRQLIRMLSSFGENTAIIIYSLHSPFLKAATDIKKRFPDIKICLIVPDLPEFMSDSKSLLYRGLKKVDAVIIKDCLKKVDAFVLLTDSMAEVLETGTRPWIRIEGIYNNVQKVADAPKEQCKTVFYSGSLARRYGIMNLLDAFLKISNDQYRLWICGEGDCKNDILAASQLDKRISYLGQISHSEVLLLQKKATVLVNPRTSEGLFTKYSFPSKTMEYLASGTPAIIHRLQGIPEAYFNYCFVVENETADGLREAILTVCEKDPTVLKEFGIKAKQFVESNKNPVTQVSKMKEMICNLWANPVI